MTQADSNLMNNQFNQGSGMIADPSLYQHETNADSECIRVCDTDTKLPIAGVRLEKGETYPLLAYYVGENTHYFDNAMVAGAFNRETGETIEKEASTRGAGIYTRRSQLNRVI